MLISCAVWCCKTRAASEGTGRYQLENQSANCLRLMLPGSTRQSVRPFKAVEPFNSQIPILAGSRSGDRHPPLSAFVAECVLDTRSDFSPQLSITEILQLNRHWHRIAILAEELAAHSLVVQTASSSKSRREDQSRTFSKRLGQNPYSRAEHRPKLLPRRSQL